MCLHCLLVIIVYRAFPIFLVASLLSSILLVILLLWFSLISFQQLNNKNLIILKILNVSTKDSIHRIRGFIVIVIMNALALLFLPFYSTPFFIIHSLASFYVLNCTFYVTCLYFIVTEFIWIFHEWGLGCESLIAAISSVKLFMNGEVLNFTF